MTRDRHEWGAQGNPDALALRLLHGEVADEGQLEELALAGLEDRHQPRDEHDDEYAEVDDGEEEERGAGRG